MNSLNLVILAVTFVLDDSWWEPRRGGTSDASPAVPAGPAAGEATTEPEAQP